MFVQIIYIIETLLTVFTDVGFPSCNNQFVCVTLFVAVHRAGGWNLSILQIIVALLHVFEEKHLRLVGICTLRTGEELNRGRLARHT